MDGPPECAPPIVHMKIAPPTEHPVPAWQITPWLQIHGITCHPASRVEFFSSLLGGKRCGFGGGMFIPSAFRASEKIPPSNPSEKYPDGASSAKRPDCEPRHR